MAPVGCATGVATNVEEREVSRRQDAKLADRQGGGCEGVIEAFYNLTSVITNIYLAFKFNLKTTSALMTVKQHIASLLKITTLIPLIPGENFKFLFLRSGH